MGLTLLWIVIGFFLFSVGLGFWCGWFVRGGEVKKLKEMHKKLMQHAIDAGWFVTEKELLDNMMEHGIYAPYIDATFSVCEGESEK